MQELLGPALSRLSKNSAESVILSHAVGQTVPCPAGFTVELQGTQAELAVKCEGNGGVQVLLP